MSEVDLIYALKRAVERGSVPAIQAAAKAVEAAAKAGATDRSLVPVIAMGVEQALRDDMTLLTFTVTHNQKASFIA